MSSIELSPATLADAPVIATIYADVTPATYCNDAIGADAAWCAEFERFLRSDEKLTDWQERLAVAEAEPDTHWWRVARIGETVVGHLEGRFHDGMDMTRLANIQVVADHQGKGVAPVLIGGLLTWAAQANPEKSVGLKVLDHNARARHVYRKYGFSEVPGSGTIVRGIVPASEMRRPAVL